MVDQLDVLRGHAFVVKGVIAEKHLAAERGLRRVVFNRKKIGKDLFADLARKRLSFVDVLLPESFRAMAEDFVEEYRCCASGQQGWPGVGIDQGSLVEPLGLMNHHLDAREHRLVIRGVLGIEPVEIGEAIDVHPIGCLALHVELKAVMNLPEAQLRAFAIHLVLVHAERREGRDGIQYRGRFTERRCISPHALFPGLAVHVNFDARATE